MSGWLKEKETPLITAARQAFFDTFEPQEEGMKTPGGLALAALLATSDADPPPPRPRKAAKTQAKKPPHKNKAQRKARAKTRRRNG